MPYSTPFHFQVVAELMQHGIRGARFKVSVAAATPLPPKLPRREHENRGRKDRPALLGVSIFA